MAEILIVPLTKGEEAALRVFALDIQNNEFKLKRLPRNFRDVA